MWRRRVRVTAGSRQAARGTWSLLQAVAEMAAPYELRTPMGTCSESCNRSADGSMATVALESMGGRGPRGADGGGERAGGAHEALPHTPPGGKPPETLAPFPWKLNDTQARESVKGSLRRQKAPPLTDSLACETHIHWEEGKGASGVGTIHCLPVVGPGAGVPNSTIRPDEKRRGQSAARHK